MYHYVLHLDPLHQDAPGLRALVQQLLDTRADALPLAQDLVEVLGAEDVPDHHHHHRHHRH